MRRIQKEQKDKNRTG